MRFKMKSLQVMSLIIATNKNKLYLYIILYYIIYKIILYNRNRVNRIIDVIFNYGNTTSSVAFTIN